MQAYEGYFENGRVFPIGVPATIKGRHRVIITVLDEPAPEVKETAHTTSWKKFLRGINDCDESLGEDFDKAMSERVNIAREFDI